jgi:hypothetical protein
MSTMPNHPAPAHADKRYMDNLANWMRQNDVESMDYWPDTVGVCQLNDLNNLMVRANRERAIVIGPNHPPRALLIGTFEHECLRSITSSHGNLIPDPPHRLRGRARQRYLDSPFELYGLTAYPLKTFSCFRIL